MGVTRHHVHPSVGSHASHLLCQGIAIDGSFHSRSRLLLKRSSPSHVCVAIQACHAVALAYLLCGIDWLSSAHSKVWQRHSSSSRTCLYVCPLGQSGRRIHGSQLFVSPRVSKSSPARLSRRGNQHGGRRRVCLCHCRVCCGEQHDLARALRVRGPGGPGEYGSGSISLFVTPFPTSTSKSNRPCTETIQMPSWRRECDRIQ